MREILRRLTSRKFLVALFVIVWWLIEGTLTGSFADIGWQIVAVALGYILGESARDALLAYWRGPKD
jgi:hypothetical protein